MTLTYNISGLPNAADTVLSAISGKTLLFYGDMGVGKTTLIKEIARKLGFSGNVTSPTFSLVNEYPLPDGMIYHFDFYRIADEKEALDFGVEEYFYSKNWNFVEWPDKIFNLLPDSKNEIYITNNTDGTRTLTIIAGE
jgi:tRNA threonylcarbamoyladenosine biosynthesis protein TsaE